MRTILIPLVVASVACGVEATTNAVTFTAPSEVNCTRRIDRPCPLLTYAHSLVLDGDVVTWGAFRDGESSQGIPAERLHPVVEVVIVDSRGAVMLAPSYDGRRAARLAPDVESDITWDLVSGTTTFRVLWTP